VLVSVCACASLLLAKLHAAASLPFESSRSLSAAQIKSVHSSSCYCSCALPQVLFMCFAIVMIFVDCLTVQQLQPNEHGHPQYTDGLGERNAIIAQIVSRLMLM
jgi:hypothetical protein